MNDAEKVTHLVFSCRIFDTLRQKVQKFEKKLLLSLDRCRPSVAKTLDDGAMEVDVDVRDGAVVDAAVPLLPQQVVQHGKVVDVEVLQNLPGDFQGTNPIVLLFFQALFDELKQTDPPS